MKKYVTKFSEDARKSLRRVPRKEAGIILDKLDQLQQAMSQNNLANLDVKKLSGTDKRYRLKVGDHYRVMYTIKETKDGSLIWIWVISVGPRENFYSMIR